MLERINTKRTSDTKRSSVSGPEYFGFGLHQVAELISKLPGADKCLRFGAGAKEKNKRQQPSIQPLHVISVPPTHSEDASLRSNDDMDDSDEIPAPVPTPATPNIPAIPKTPVLAHVLSQRTSPAEVQKFPQTLNLPNPSSFMKMDPNLYMGGGSTSVVGIGRGVDITPFQKPLGVPSSIPGLYLGYPLGQRDLQAYYKSQQAAQMLGHHNMGTSGMYRAPIVSHSAAALQNLYYKTQLHLQHENQTNIYENNKN